MWLGLDPDHPDGQVIVSLRGQLPFFIRAC